MNIAAKNAAMILRNWFSAIKRRNVPNAAAPTLKN
jgi:hypothetical protein